MSIPTIRPARFLVALMLLGTVRSVPADELLCGKRHGHDRFRFDLSPLVHFGADLLCQDRERAQRLVDLNALILRDLLRNHTYAINVPGLVWGTAGYAKWRPLGGCRVTPRDESWLERLDAPRYGLTGREQRLEELFQAYGLGD